MNSKRFLDLRRLSTLASVVGTATLLAACGSASSTSSGTSSDRSAGVTSGPVQCGLGNGKKATGTPIKIGAIGTKVPGLDFTAAPLASQAYFACVNANGGINGHPIDYVLEDDSLVPSLTQSLAAKLVQTDHVAAIVGSASINECAAPAQYYAANGVTAEISMGLPQNCFATKNVAPVNSAANTTLGLAAVEAAHGAKRIVVGINAGPNIQQTINAPFAEWSKRTGVAVKIFIEPAPIASPTSLALRISQAAGSNGGVVLSFDPADEVAVMKAVQQQGLGNQDQWGSSSQSASNSFAQALGSYWNGKFLIADEFALPSSPAAATYRAVETKYGGGAQLSAIGENGFVAAQIATQAMLKLPSSELNRAGINAAFARLTNVSSSLYCTPYFFGPQSFHMSNYQIRTDVTKNNQLVAKYGCSDIPATQANNVAGIKAYAKAHGMA